LASKKLTDFFALFFGFEDFICFIYFLSGLPTPESAFFGSVSGALEKKLRMEPNIPLDFFSTFFSFCSFCLGRGCAIAS